MFAINFIFSLYIVVKPRRCREFIGLQAVVDTSDFPFIVAVTLATVRALEFASKLVRIVFFVAARTIRGWTKVSNIAWSQCFVLPPLLMALLAFKFQMRL
jgi:hypothetical protein